jgi:hypothetical protein
MLLSSGSLIGQLDGPTARLITQPCIPLAGIASLIMVRIILDFHDERHAVLGPPRQAPVTNVRVIEDGVQFAQVMVRKPHVYTVPNNGREHVFLSHFSAQCARLDRADYRNVATTIVNAATPPRAPDGSCASPPLPPSVRPSTPR